MSTYNMDVHQIIRPPLEVYEQDEVEWLGFMAGTHDLNPYPRYDDRRAWFDTGVARKILQRLEGDDAAFSAI